MALDFNTKLPANTPGRRLELVEAILSAPGDESEPDWLEWKSVLDLKGDAGHRFTVAKNILAFANREPDRAARNVGGEAYVVVGAEPMKLHGLTMPDLAQLEDWLRPYIVSRAPHWDANLVSKDGLSVLFISVASPQWGHPPHTLRKGWENFRPGTIFIRRQGQVAQADPTEVEMLVERARRDPMSQKSIAVELSLDHVRTLPRYELDESVVTSWIEAERTSLLGSLPTQRGGPFSGVSILERRSVEEFRREVELYSERASFSYCALGLRGMIIGQRSAIRVVLHNRTHENFRQVQLALSHPKGTIPVFGEDDCREVTGGGERPCPWGSSSMFSGPIVPRLGGFSQGLRDPDFRGANITPLDGAFLAEYGTVSLRAGESLPLAPLHVFVGREAEGPLTIPWKATCSNLPGISEGALDLEIAPDPSPFHPLVKAGEAED